MTATKSQWRLRWLGNVPVVEYPPDHEGADDMTAKVQQLHKLQRNVKALREEVSECKRQRRRLLLVIALEAVVLLAAVASVILSL